MKYKKNKKDTLVGILAVIAVVSLLYAVNDNLTGESVKTLNSGTLEVLPIHEVELDVYIDGEFLFTNPRTDKRPFVKIEAGTHVVIVKDTSGVLEDWISVETFEAGKKNKIYPWSSS